MWLYTSKFTQLSLHSGARLLKFSLFYFIPFPTLNITQLNNKFHEKEILG